MVKCHGEITAISLPPLAFPQHSLALGQNIWNLSTGKVEQDRNVSSRRYT